MKSMDILEVVGSIRDKYILEAGKVRESTPPARKNHTHSYSFRIAAMIALVLAGILFLQTPVGVAAVEMVKESVSRLIETLFPPKDIIVMPEGTPEVVHHEAQGRDPVEESPGFVMYVDTESYVMTEESGVYYVRQIPVEYDRESIRDKQSALLEGLSPEEQEAAIDARIQELKDFYASLPANEIEIREIPGKECSAYAQEVRNQMSAEWQISEDIHWIDKPLPFTFSVSGGTSWDSTQEDHYFIDNGKQGTFHIVARCYLEAAEGHGMRFLSMIKTFEIVTNEDTAKYGVDTENTAAVMRQVFDAAIDQNMALLKSAEQDPANESLNNDISTERYALWLDTMDAIWPALEQKLDPETMQDLMVSQLEWSTWQIQELKNTEAQAKDGFVSAALHYGTGADLLEHRVTYLMNVLEGTAPVLPRDPSTELSAEAVISQFIRAYYSGDRETVAQCLSSSYNGNVDVYTDFEPADPEINAIKGLENPVHDMAIWGAVRPAIQFRKTPDSDYYMYLSMTLTWEDNQWKVSEYGLEG